MLSKLTKLEEDLVSDLYSAKMLGPSLMEEGKESVNQVSSLSRHVSILALTFSCLYNEVLHEGKSPRHRISYLKPGWR